jgi:hypothetical protein
MLDDVVRTSLTAYWQVLTAKPAAGRHTQIRSNLRASGPAAAATPLHTNSAVWSASLGLTSLQVPTVCDME